MSKKAASEDNISIIIMMHISHHSHTIVTLNNIHGILLTPTGLSTYFVSKTQRNKLHMFASE